MLIVGSLIIIFSRFFKCFLNLLVRVGHAREVCWIFFLPKYKVIVDDLEQICWFLLF